MIEGVAWVVMDCSGSYELESKEGLSVHSILLLSNAD